MQENYLEFQQEIVIELLEKITEKYPNDLDTTVSMYLHIVDSIHATVLNWCHVDDRNRFIKEITDRTLQNLIQVNDILSKNEIEK